jgi:hypothetical protein
LLANDSQQPVTAQKRLIAFSDPRAAAEAFAKLTFLRFLPFPDIREKSRRRCQSKKFQTL